VLAAFNRRRWVLYSDPAIQKVLIYRTGSLGDTIVALPSLHLIARAFPRAERVLLTDLPVHAKAPTAMAVLKGSGLVHRDMRYMGATRKISEMMRMIWGIRRFHPDVLVHLLPRHSLSDVQRDRLFFKFAGLRRIVGLPSDEVLTHRFDPATGLYESEASLLARSIAELGDADPRDIGNWDLHLNAAEVEVANRALSGLVDKPFIVCAPGCKMQVNEWERENWRALLGRLYTRYPSYALVMSGIKEEVELCEYAARDWAGAKLNLSGRLNPRESAAVYRRTLVLIGTDSGPKHLAATVGTPCVCVYSARNLPGVWYPPGRQNVIVQHRPECAGCNLQTCIVMEKKCIRSVTVDEMEQAVHTVLKHIRCDSAGILATQKIPSEVAVLNDHRRVSDQSGEEERMPVE
jgi:heptosyltransferase III